MCKQYSVTDSESIHAMSNCLKNLLNNKSEAEDIGFLLKNILMMLGISEFSDKFSRFLPYAVLKYVEENVRDFDNMPSSIHQLTTEQLFCILLIGAERQEEFNNALKEHRLKEVLEQRWNWQNAYEMDNLVFRFLEFFSVIETALDFPENVVISFDATKLGYYPFYNKACMLSIDSVVLPSPTQYGFDVVKVTKRNMFENLKKAFLFEEEKVSFLQEVLEIALTADTDNEEVIEELGLRDHPPISIEEYKNQWIVYNEYQDSSFHPAY